MINQLVENWWSTRQTSFPFHSFLTLFMVTLLLKALVTLHLSLYAGVFLLVLQLTLLLLMAQSGCAQALEILENRGI